MIPTTASEIASRWHALTPDLRAALIRHLVPVRVRQDRRNRARGRLYAPLRREPGRAGGPAVNEPLTAARSR